MTTMAPQKNRKRNILLAAVAIAAAGIMTSCMGLGFGVDIGDDPAGGPYWYDGIGYDGIYSPYWGPSVAPPPPFLGGGPVWNGPIWGGGNPGPALPPPGNNSGASRPHQPAFPTTPNGTMRPGNNGMPSVTIPSGVPSARPPENNSGGNGSRGRH